MRTIHLFPAPGIEKGTATRWHPRPGYRWHPAWAEALPDGATTQALLLSEYRALYKAGYRELDRECRIVLHRNEQAARDAVDNQLPST